MKISPARDDKNVRSKKENISELKKNGKTIHVATLMHLCHLKNVELTKHHPKDKVPVVLLEDNV